MNDTANLIIAWVLGISLFLIFGVPLAMWLVRRTAHRKRLRLERSRREIVVAADAVATGETACPHKRSKSRAVAGPDGQMRSICRFCGVPMLRHGPGDWEVLAPDGAQHA